MPSEKDVTIRLGVKAKAGLNSVVGKIQNKMRGLRKTANSIFSFKSLAVSGAAGAASMGVIVNKAISAGDALDKMAQRTQTSVEFLAGLKHAAESGGNEFEHMEDVIRTMTQSAAEAHDGVESYAAEFRNLGVDVRDANLRLRDSEGLFLDTVDALSKVENKSRKIAIATRIFGEAGTRLIPMLGQGKDGIIALINESNELGNIWTNKTAKGAADILDSFSRVKLIGSNLADTLGVALFPSIQEITDQTVEWFKANRELISSRITEWGGNLGS